MVFDINVLPVSIRKSFQAILQHYMLSCTAKCHRQHNEKSSPVSKNTTTKIFMNCQY